MAELTQAYWKAFRSKVKSLISSAAFNDIHNYAKASAGGTVSRRGKKDDEVEYEAELAVEKQAPPMNELGFSVVDQLARVIQDGKLTQEEANYVEQTDNASIACGSCRFYLRTSGNPVGQCEVVDGDINWFGSSDAYISAADEAEHALRVEQAKNNTTSYHVEFVEKQAELRQVTGIVLKPNVPDAHGDVVTEAEIAKAHEAFMLNSQIMNLQHDRVTGDEDIDQEVNKNQAQDVRIVESYIAPADMHLAGRNVSKGSWIITVKVLKDAVWELVKAGKFTGFSIEGTAKRIPLA